MSPFVFCEVKVKVTQLCLTLFDTLGHTVHRILQARKLEWVGFPFSRGSSQPRDQTGISCIAGGCFYQLSYEGNSPQNKYAVLSCSVISHFFVTSWTVACQAPLCMGILQHKSTGVGCHALLQGIFPTQGSNPGLLHCKQILYHLSHQGSPCVLTSIIFVENLLLVSLLLCRLEFFLSPSCFHISLRFWLSAVLLLWA